MGSLAGGLAAAPFLPGPPLALLVIAVVAAGALWCAGGRGPRTCAAALLALAAGMVLGAARVEAIDAGALRVRDAEPVMRTGDGELAAQLPGSDVRVEVRGFVEAVPRRDRGEIAVRIATAHGRLLVRAREPVADLPVGREVAAAGRLRGPAEWERRYLTRLGVASVLEARRIELSGARRGGIAYLLDRVRERAEAALGRGTPAPEASLLRGFVLGQDDRIDPRTVEDYQRSGLAHLLAVSGQNVVLLAVLAGPVLALFGLGVRGRLIGILLLIALYVPVAGAGPSIQRAGVMGAAGVVATLAGRPASRWYALLLAAAATLALNPRATGDVGWQLSFAAVIGIGLWTAPLRTALGGQRGRGDVRSALAEGAAVTIAATVATAPLMAHHFDRLSLASLVANLLALPAVAPVMWLGMLAATVGQLPWLPVEPLTGLAGLFAAYITQVAAWLAAPSWAQVELGFGGPGDLAAVYGALLLTGWLIRRRGARGRTLRAPPRLRRLAVATVLGGLALAGLGRAGEGRPDAGLVVRFLDVGQGDAILLEPRRSEPILVDTGPADDSAAERLRELGIDRLEAVLVTHADSDHAGGLASVLAAAEVGMVGWAVEDAGITGAARAAGVDDVQLAAGAELNAGGLSLRVLWPPPALVDEDAPLPGEPNELSLVTVARWRNFDLFLPGDGEAEAVPVDPGPVEVLKLAHHGSEDAGLSPLLDRTEPALAVASVGAGNPFGHPALATAADLASHGIPLERTDTGGEIVLAVEGERWNVLEQD